MKISVNTIRTVNKIYDSAGDPAPEGVDHLVRKIGDQLGAVEEVMPFGERFAGVIVAKVASYEDHPNADRLHICKIDDGGVVQGVERDENGHVQVVCGATNVRAGIMVAWLPPGATVPSSFYDVDTFVLDVRKLRGVLSNGMLASPRELSIGDNHDGIMELDDEHKPGTPFVEAYDLQGEAVIDIENKMFTHRPDCFGQLGVAREIAGIHGQSYKSPAWYVQHPEFPGVEAEEIKLEVHNDIPELVPRFTAIALGNVTVKPSPVWLQIYLASMGLRPISNIVDYANYFMLETGQPLHAYDYDKVKALSDGDHVTMVVRTSTEGEAINLLNGKRIDLQPGTMVIANDRQPIALGGVMGGADTEVDEHTKNIILECANFDMYTTRRVSMTYGLFTDAVTRFSKGQSPLQNLAVLAKIVDEIRKFADGKVASALIDDNHVPAEAMERGSIHPPVVITAQFINERLGLHLSAAKITTLLTNVEFAVAAQSDDLTVTAPFWRTDIAIPEDIVEEVGRLYGYDYLPLELPHRSLEPAQKDELLETKRHIRELLARAGANEVLGYSFVHGNLIDKVGQDRNLAFRVSNAISPELQYYRLSLTPSLLEKVQPNIKAGYTRFALFEIGKTHNKLHATDGEDGLPKEHEMLAFTVAAADKKTAAKTGDKAAAKAGAPYYEARKYLDYLANAIGVGLIYKPLAEAATADADDSFGKPFDHQRSATVCIAGTDDVLGIVGEYRRPAAKSLKLPATCAGFEIDIATLLAAHKPVSSYRPLPRFPRVEQDICLRVPADLPYGELYLFVGEHLHQNRPDQTAHTLSPVDIYQRADDNDHKQITLRLSIASFERTLTDDEVNSLLESVAAAAHDAFGAERI